MAEKKSKKKKTRKVRSRKERIRDLEAKLAEEKARASLEGLKTAVKEGRVDDDNHKEYRKLLRYMKVMEKAPSVFNAFDMEEESESASNLRDRLIKELKDLLNDESGDEDELEDEDEGEDEEDEEDDDDEDDDDEDDDDEDEEDDDD